MKNITIHIGMHKTASSSIQKILSVESELLNEHGIIYPSSGRINNEMHHALAYDIIREFNGNYKFFYGMNDPGASWNDLYKELSECEINNIILSSEELFRILTICGQEGLFVLKEKLLKITEKIKIIVYIRKQDDFFNSAYNQCIKFDNITYTANELSSKLKILEIDYYKQLMSWCNVFGRENIIVRSFDKEKLYQNNIIKDFFNIINVPLKDSVNISYNENLALPLSFLEIRREINKIDTEYPKYRDEINDVIQGLSYLDDLEDVFILDKNYYLENVKKWESVNNKISSEFFNGKPLFSKSFKSISEIKFISDCDINYRKIILALDAYLKQNSVTSYTANLFFEAIRNIVKSDMKLITLLSNIKNKFNVRTFVSIYTTHYKKNDNVINSPCFVPIHVGNSLAEESYYEVTDSAGDNISERNPIYCELTAHYWVWKNKLDSDYIGFMHHRRHLCFNKSNKDKKNIWGLISYPEINEDYIAACGLDDKTIKNEIYGYDIVIAEKWDVRITGSKNNYELIKNTDFLHIEDYDKALSILIDKHPEYKPYIDEYNDSHYGFYTNIFIMRKELFRSYAEWIFPILFDLESSIDVSSYSSAEKRVIGHIAERLLSIYLLKIINEERYRVKELKRTIVEDTNNKSISFSEDDIRIKAIPSFPKDEKHVPIVVNFNEAYSHVAAACIQSIVSNTSPSYNYDIFILGNAVSYNSINRYKNMVSYYDNIEISYIDVSNESFINKLYVNQYFSIETYFRLFIPKIFDDFGKVIYLDVDMIVNKDLAELFKIDLNDKLVAAVPCYVMQSFIKNHVVSNNETGNLVAIEYLDKYLNIGDKKSYIQAGLIVFDNEKLNNFGFVSKIIDELESTYWFLDQDIINKVLNGRVKLLPFNWNVMHGNNNLENFVASLPTEEKIAYLKARENPYVVHYAGPEKPWNNKNVEFSDLFWMYMQKTIWFTDMVFYSLHSQPNVTNDIPAYKRVIRKSFDLLFPLGTRRRVVFSRCYKRIRGL